MIFQNICSQYSSSLIIFLEKNDNLFPSIHSILINRSLFILTVVRTFYTRSTVAMVLFFKPQHHKCTCPQQQRFPISSSVSEFHKSLSIVDYIDFDVSDDSSSSSKHDHDDEDPLTCLKYLFDDQNKQSPNINFIRRAPRRSTNTSSISADSGYSDIPIGSSKLIPVHLISCTLIPVNVTRTESMDVRCLRCTCPSSSTYFSNKMERRQRRRRKSSAYSQTHGTYSRQQMDIIENEMKNHCSCNKK